MCVSRYPKGIILYRVPEFLSSRLNWVPTAPSQQAGVSSPLGSWGGGEDTLACWAGGGGPIQTTGQKP